MTQVWDENNRIVPVTVVKAGPCVVTAGPHAGQSTATTPSRSPSAQIDPRKVNKPLAGHFAKAGVTPRRHLVEIRTDRRRRVHARPGGHRRGVRGRRRRSTSPARARARATAGVMKRHGFKGLGAGHGAQRKHRSPGSIGGCATPGRVFKGMRMAGRMGDERVDHPEPDRPRRRRREGPAAHQGRRPRSQRRPRPRPHRRQGRPDGKADDAPIDVLVACTATRPAPSSCPPRSSTSRSTSR